MKYHCFKKVTKQKENEINNLFPTLQDLIIDYIDTGFNYLGITVFDHWLTQDEAIKELDSNSLELKRDKQLFNLNKELQNKFEVYFVKIRGRRKEKVVYRHIRNFKCLEGGYNGYDCGNRGIYILPKLKAIYIEGYDHTYHLYYLDKVLIDDFLKLVDEHILFALT